MCVNKFDNVSQNLGLDYLRLCHKFSSVLSKLKDLKAYKSVSFLATPCTSRSLTRSSSISLVVFDIRLITSSVFRFLPPPKMYCKHRRGGWKQMDKIETKPPKIE